MQPAFQTTAGSAPQSRGTAAFSVLLLHLLALWALQAGLLQHVAMPVQAKRVMVMLLTPEPARPVAPAAPALKPIPVKETPWHHNPALANSSTLSQPQNAMQPDVAEMAPPTSPAGNSTQLAAPATTPTTPAATGPLPPRIEVPSSDADYLQNPKPPYPPLSKRLGEQGQVMVRVLIGPDGVAQKAEVRRSSGFDRLDQMALATVLRWRYVPGKRDGIPEAMWFNVPIRFELS